MPRRCDHPTGPPQPDTCKVCRKYADDPKYAALCDAGLPRRPNAPPRRPPAPTFGPGTELKAILNGLGFSTCGPCGEMARRMDSGGPDWCRANRGVIVVRLAEARKDAGWMEKVKATVKAVTTGLAFTLDPLDPLGSLVDEAIRRAVAKAAPILADHQPNLPGWSRPVARPRRAKPEAVQSFPCLPLEGLGILVTGGIGDVFAIEGMLTRDQRDQLTTIYYAAPAVAELRTLMSALPNYPRLQNHVVLPSGSRTHYSRFTVERVHGRLPVGVEDWSIGTIFPRRLPYTGSSFLAHRLADPELPPSPYVVVVPHSTWGQWPGRNFDAADWLVCLDTLDRHGLTGVVLCREKLAVPAHPRLLDWQGRTSILGTVEVVKGASGYIGIDSALSVLAAKLFPAARLAVKGFQAHFLANLPAYYAPHASFPFVRPTLEAPTWN